MNYFRHRLSVGQLRDETIASLELGSILHEMTVAERHAVATLEQDFRVEGLRALLQHVQPVTLPFKTAAEGLLQLLGEGEQAVLLPLTHPREGEGQRVGEMRQTQVLALQMTAYMLHDEVLESLEVSQVRRLAVEDESRHGRGSLQTGVCHTVQHRLVTVMTYAREDGQGKLSHDSRQGIGIEV